ncbi:MAG: hypothetical protein NTY74_03165 [Ignavibacteriae bacterium]|nr:hypothetical protein [Ignavibacteriota bacterium]
MEDIDLIRQYAKAWNNLDVKFIEHYLSNDYHFESQMGFNHIKSKTEYLRYLDDKFNIIKKANEEGDSFLNAEIGYYNDNPCLILLQIHNEPKMTGSLTKIVSEGKEEWINKTSKVIETVLLIECEGDKISSGILCIIPTAYEVQRTGELPI